MRVVMKFGGTSVANADRMNRVADIVTNHGPDVVVVTSAMAGVTDGLLAIAETARSGAAKAAREQIEVLRKQHRDAAEGVARAEDVRDLETAHAAVFDELAQVVEGVALLRELSDRSHALVASFGERFAVPLLVAALRRAGGAAEPVDAREIIRTQPAFGGEAVDMAPSRDLARARLGPLLPGTTPVVTGFIATGADGHTTTLDRGGSDYTATLIGAFVDADEVWIWTDVDGVMTADPRLVPEARVLPTITYREAAEMAYFGSKVLHPRTMIPVAEMSIPVCIRNTFRPELAGTRITDQVTASDTLHPVKTVTSVPDLALVTVEGNGMIGVPGVMRRVFATTAKVDVNVFMVSQASSEHNISFVVKRADGPVIVAGLEAEFEREIARRQIDRVRVLDPVGILAVIGDGMKGTPGVSQRLFTALGRGRINVYAIAQGSSELNLSTVVREEDLPRAVGAVHTRFGLTRSTHVFIFGKGLVGRELIRQIVKARSRLAEDQGLRLDVMGICGRQEQLIANAGLDDAALGAVADGAALSTLGGEARLDDDALLARLSAGRWLDVIIVDVTADENASLHAKALAHGFHVVTANKKPMAGSLETYDAIMTAAHDQGTSYLFETTFGAGLPALSTLQDFIATRDDVHRVTGCFSGTLGLIASALDGGALFSSTVREARALGFTEPDPREDLSGRDVARKALIIARTLGRRIEADAMEVTGMLPDVPADEDVETFMAGLERYDAEMARQAEEAGREGAVLRYLAEIDADGVRVGLRRVSRNEAAGQLSGPDNLLVFETNRYREHPLVIRGPGAGAAVTAAGVLGDLLKIVRMT